MVNIALAPSTVEDRMMIHMLSTMHFSLVAGPAPDTVHILDTAHILDMVLSHNRVECHSQLHILHHPRPLLKRLSRDMWDRMALMEVILGGFTCLSMERLTLLRLVQLMGVSRCPWEWELVPRTALQCPWISLRLIKGQP